MTFTVCTHGLDVEVEQIAGSGMLIAHDQRSGMQVANLFAT
jgi:hypothetical protein